MNLRFQESNENIDFSIVRDILKKVGMGYTEVEKHKKSFESSYAVCFVFDNEKLIGFGRSISDGVRQAAIYDVAINPDYQGKSIGKQIMTRLLGATPECTVILYAALGKEDFYKKLGFKVTRTGMILFSDPSKMNDNNWVVV